MSTVTITGGTGLIGTALRQALTGQGYNIIILTRDRSVIKSRDDAANDPALRFAYWDPSTGELDKSAIQDADYLIHLAGANVGEKRWTKKRKQEIIDSRVISGELVSRAIKEISNNIKAVISASAIGWYGPDRTEGHLFNENDPAYPDFLGSTCEKWEQSISKVEEAGKRLVIFRTGIVLSKEGGALKEFIKPLKAGIATILGNGKQVVSWIHIKDLVNMYLFAITDEKVSGIYNAVSPQPVSNRELILSLARARKKNYLSIKVPSAFLNMVLGEMSIEVLKSATVSSKKIGDAGFNFEYAGIEEAMKSNVKENQVRVA